MYDDAHVHLAFVEHPEWVAHAASAAGSYLYSVTTHPEEFIALQRVLAGGVPTLRQAVGLHPWWVPQDISELSVVLTCFDEAFAQTPFVGEVGLDFSPRRVGSRELQLLAFRYIASACAQVAGKVLSIHCVQAYDELLSILKETGCAQYNTCIIHWFSGSSQHVQLAINMGCYFSVSLRMLHSKRGRAYAKAIPADRLLLETDAPLVENPEHTTPCVPYVYEELARELAEAHTMLAAVRDADEQELAAIMHENFMRATAG